MADLANPVGQQLGNYRILRLLGQGGFADVYLGEHIHLNTLAAIKVLRAQLAADTIESFRMEARTVAHLVHPNIVRVLDFGVEGTAPYLVMEYAPNGTLRQRHPRGIPVPVSVVVPYVKQVAAALQYAHNRKLIHRDIKPENMLVGSNNDILLSDFGIAVMTQSARTQGMANQGWDAAGTAAYMAPEQIQGKTTPASDQYALATVVYEWLTGVVPFVGTYMEVVTQQISATPPSLHEKVPNISPDVEQVVLTALSKDPQQRFGRIEAFANALEHAVEPKPFFPSDDSTILATPSSPGGGIGNFGSNTNYGGDGANYPNMQPDYQATIPAQPSYTPNLTPNQRQSYTPSQTPFVVPGARTPINMPSSYGQYQQQASYMPQQPPPYVPSQQPPYQPPSPQRRPSMLRNLILAIIALVIILGGLGSFFVVHNNQVAQQNADATATAVANTHAQATATANAAVAATAAVNATTTALVTSHYPPFTNLAFFDPLTSNNGTTQWNTSAGCQFASSGYLVSIDRVGFVQWCNNGKQLGELAYQATMTVVSGDCGGLVYRYVDANDFYLFEVCQNGTYNSGDFVGGKANYLYSSPKANSAIHQGVKQSNIIAVTVQGNTINMYVNGQNIDSATSDALTNSTFAQGQFGMLAYDTVNPTSVTYRNAAAWTAS